MAINKIFGGQSNLTNTIQDFQQVRKIPTLNGSLQQNIEEIPFYNSISSKGIFGITIDDLLSTGRCFPELERFFNDLKRQLNEKIGILNKLLSLIWAIIDLIKQIMNAVSEYGLFQILWNQLMLLLNQMLAWLVKMGLRYILDKLYQYIRDFNKFLNSSALMKRLKCMTDAILTNNKLPTINGIISHNRNVIVNMLNSQTEQFLQLAEKVSGYQSAIPTIQGLMKPLQSVQNNQFIKGKVPNLGNLQKDPFTIMKGGFGRGFKF